MSKAVPNAAIDAAFVTLSSTNAFKGWSSSMQAGFSLHSFVKIGHNTLLLPKIIARLEGLCDKCSYVTSADDLELLHYMLTLGEEQICQNLTSKSRRQMN